MSIVTVRTIKVTDYIGGPSYEECLTLDSRRMRSATLASIAEQLPLREQALREEQGKLQPNAARIETLRKMVENMRHTLRASKRQK